jgi:Secretion system C-terminal sorting domain
MFFSLISKKYLIFGYLFTKKNMKIMKKTLLFSLLMLSFGFFSKAYIPIQSHGRPSAKSEQPKRFLGDCAQAKSFADLKANNVRAKLLGGGDLWWNLQEGTYVVPTADKISKTKSNFFASALWFGGIDGGGNLKMACNMYRRTTDNDWWAGPLDMNGEVSSGDCFDWDKHFTVYKSEIETFKQYYAAAQKDGDGKILEVDFLKKIPKNVLGWCARDNPYFLQINGVNLAKGKNYARWYDNNNDNIYDPRYGDYPIFYYDKGNSGAEVNNRIPDQMVFWIFNDKGGVHTSSNAQAIGLEVKALSFGYETNDDLNNMSFLKYDFTNKSSNALDSCFIGLWLDSDGSCPGQERFGCDLTPDYMGNPRTMQYIYTNDESKCPVFNTSGYRSSVIAIDILDLPFKTSGNDINGARCETGFMYFLNGSVGGNPAVIDPDQPIDFYRYLNSVWKDGTPLSVGGIGYTPNPDPKKIAKHAFPDEPTNKNGWSMQSVGWNFPFDTRTVLSAGAFRMSPGTSNSIIYSVPFVSNQGGAALDLTSIRRASTAARDLFHRNFALTGPKAPDLSGFGLDNAVVVNIGNAVQSPIDEEINYKEQSFLLPNNIANKNDEYYKFEGYLIYQVKDANTSVGDVTLLNNNAKLVAQTDISNGVKKVYNWTPEKDPSDPSFPIFYPKLVADGDDKGIKRSFYFEKDIFTGKPLENGVAYHYVLIPYAYNNYENFNKGTGNGQKRQFLQGTGQKVTLIPQKSFNDFLYGQFLPITRYDGNGVGGSFLDINDDMYEKMLSPNFDGVIDYKAGQSPITIKVNNPSKLQKGEYYVRFFDSDMTDGSLAKDARWEFWKKGAPAIISSKTLDFLNEEVIAQYGVSVAIGQQKNPCSIREGDGGLMPQTITYKNPNGQKWLKALHHEDISLVDSLPLSHSSFLSFNDDVKDCLSDVTYDAQRFLAYPYSYIDYRLRPIGVNSTEYFPYYSSAWFNNSNNLYFITGNKTALTRLRNVDLILTKDKTKWSRCVVIETGNNLHTFEGLETEKGSLPNGGQSFSLRAGKSVGSDTDPDAPSDGTTGKSWFPGYAVDVETGERLNIVFGENSGYDPKNQVLLDAFKFSTPPTSRDMLWNPTSDGFLKASFEDKITIINLFFGGGHHIYVLNEKYDKGDALHQLAGTTNFSRTISRQANWVTIPYLEKGTQLLSYKDGLIPNDLTLKMRLNRPYQVSFDKWSNQGHPSYGFVINDKVLSSSEISKNDTPKKFKVYPSPAKIDATVTLSDIPFSKCQMTIYDVSGRLVKQQKNISIGESQSYIFGTDNLSQGLYFIVLNDGKFAQSQRVVLIE